MVKIRASPRYVIEITRPDLPSLGELGAGGGANFLKIRKNELFFTYEGVIGPKILENA